MMHEMGIETGLQVEDVIDTALMAEEFCGRALLGHVSRSGPIRHQSNKSFCLQDLRPGKEIPAALLFAGKIKERLSGEELVNRVIREALGRNWVIPDGLKLSNDSIALKGELGATDILVTKLKVLSVQKEENQGILEVLSQKANGDVFLEGQVKLLFPQVN